MTINAYPLQWPTGWKRTPVGEREHARFSGTTTRYVAGTIGGSGATSYKQKRDLTIAEGRRRVLAELERMGIPRDDLVLSTNLPLRLDGEPRSDAREPADPGVAVYWQDGEHRRVMAIDRYDRVADNLAAVAATIDAMRAIERHGGAVILERAYTGFTALPAPGGETDWRKVLKAGDGPTAPSPEDLKALYRRAAASAHPDRGGTADAMSTVNNAYEQAQRSLGYA